MRIRAVFDADILLNLVKTKAIDIAVELLGCIYVSDYVYDIELSRNSEEKKVLEKLKNTSQIKILKYNDLTDRQKRVYVDTYRLLKSKDVGIEHDDNVINQGERITAAFAKALNVYYYMSDDNRAAPHIKSLAAIEIINYCDILFMNLYIYGKRDCEKLEKCYRNFIELYNSNNIPRVIRDKNNRVFEFKDIMARCFDKFKKEKMLMDLTLKLKSDYLIEIAVDEDKV